MSESRQQGLKVWLSRLAPYLIAALALAWVFRTTDLGKLKEALQRANLLLFVGFSAVILVANCAADTFAMWRVFGWFGCHVKYTELFIIRASTYLLAVINYHVGQAAIVGYLYRARKVPLLQATGWILFIIGINVGTLFVLASGGAWKATGNLSFLHVIPVATVAGAAVWAIILTIKPRVLAERRVLRPLFEMGIVGHVKGVLVRLPHVGVLIIWHLGSLRMFVVNVPVLDALLFLPIYFATSSLPINVNGLGAAQLVAIAFFSPYAGDPATGRAAVIAYSLGTSLVSIFLQLGLGVMFIGKATKLGLPRQAPEEIEAEAARAVAADAHAQSTDENAAAEV
jgi:hypothetical protein